ncbi:MAG: 6-bladed beta-propeller [Gemmatimonadales bacterium]|nr:6-bladed beta-propeller [Gemmatimonadales bacterium]MYK02021.1 6-bladed beta-propeller [Candidatus Palauibacter ramosifaciens]
MAYDNGVVFCGMIVAAGLCITSFTAAAAAAQEELPTAYRVPDEPKLEIGSVDEPGSSLFGVTDAIVLRDSRILVADGGSRTLKFFDARGGFLSSLGRSGDGPGEFRSLYRIAEFDDGKIAALDPMLGRVTVFSADGGLEETYQISRQFNEIGQRTRLFGFLANGTLVGIEEVEGQGVEMHYGDYPSSVLTYRAPVVQPVFVDLDGRTVPFARPVPGSQTVSEIRSSVGSGSIRVGGGLVSVPFLRSLQIAVRGDWIALGPIDKYLVGAFGADGAPRAFFGGPPPNETPEGAHEAWLDRQVAKFARRSERSEWRDRYEEFLSSDLAPATLPSFKSLAIQDDGIVWREVYEPTLTDYDPSLWIVNDPSRAGGVVGTVTLPSGFRPYDIGRDYVLGVWRDELDIEFVQVYDLIETPSE